MIKENFDNNGYDYVDLGLPSGTIWATMNVGASNPLDRGLYFQWGDTQGYTIDQIEKGKQLNLDNYKWYDADNNIFTKYANPCATLDLEDDAAHANMGGDWHMPTPEQIKELIVNTTSEFEILNADVSYLTLASKKDTSKYIFFPTAGFAWDGSVHNSGDNGYVWSSMLNMGNADNGRIFVFGSDDAYISGGNRYFGFSVRGVIDKNNNKRNKNMNENLNLVDILKNAPKGTKLWSPIYGKCTFLGIDEDGSNNEHSNYPIDCEASRGRCCFTKEGKIFEEYNDTECVLFPSKENRNSSTFKAPKKHKEFKPFQKVLVGLIMDGKQIWKRDVYMYYRKDVKGPCTVFEAMVPDDRNIPYDANKDGKLVKLK